MKRRLSLALAVAVPLGLSVTALPASADHTDPNVDNGDGTRTYYFLADDIQRGIDIFSWRGPTNFPSQARAVAEQLAAQQSGIASGDAGLLALALIILPAAARIGRRRQARR